jgi:signal transduction histidine kinase
VKISHRLYLTVAPAIVAVLLLAGLMYWGQFAHAAPEVVIVFGILAVVTSLVLTWSNARFVARRIERIVAGFSSRGDHKPSLRGMASAIAPGKTSAPPDEIDEIESVVDRLSSAVAIAEVKSADRERLFEQRAQDYARLLASIADASAKRLEEVRLPLHILLENHFGDLNENQEEMLGAARAAAEAADADMLSLRQIAELDLGERLLRQDRMKPSDIVDALRPMLIAAAESAGVTLELDIAPMLPAIIGDRALLQDALVTVLRETVAGASRDSQVRIELDRSGSMIRIAVAGDGAPPATVRWAAAIRVIQAHGGMVDRRSGTLEIELPTEGHTR